MPKLFSFKH